MHKPSRTLSAHAHAHAHISLVHSHCDPSFLALLPFAFFALFAEFPLADSDYMLIAQIAPQLAALQVRATSSQHPPLSTAGLISFIGKAPNLRLLELTGVVALMDNGEPDCSAPAGNNLHHLWLRNCEVDRPSFDFVLRCIGRELRSISMREYYPVMYLIVFVRAAQGFSACLRIRT